MAAIDAISISTRRLLLEVLMHMAWADRQITPEERQASQAAAMALGLVLPGDQDITSNDRLPIDLDSLNFASLPPRDRELVFVCACWMSLADAERHTEETAVLDQLATKMSISDARRELLDETSRKLRQHQTSERTSWWRAFDKLVVEAARSLPSA